MLDLLEMSMIDKTTGHLVVVCKGCTAIRTIYDPDCLECTTSFLAFKQRHEHPESRCWYCDDCLNTYSSQRKY